MNDKQIKQLIGKCVSFYTVTPMGFYRELRGEVLAEARSWINTHRGYDSSGNFAELKKNQALIVKTLSPYSNFPNFYVVNSFELIKEKGDN